MATLHDVAWLLPQLRFLAEGNAITGLSRSFAHDARLLGSLVREEQLNRNTGSRRLTYAAKQDDVSRLRELLVNCEPDPFALAAALGGGQEPAARLLLGKGASFTAAVPHLSHNMSATAVSSTGPLLRELCADLTVPRTAALAVGVMCGLLDVIASARDGAFSELGFVDGGAGDDDSACACMDYVSNEIHPRNASAARLLAEHPYFTLFDSLSLAMSENGAMLYSEAAEWVDDLCQRVVGSNDTPELRNLALAAAAATGAAQSVPGLLARGAVFDDARGPGENALILAAQHGHHDLLRLIYSTPDDYNQNLFACVAAGLTSCAKDLILHHGFNANDYHSEWDCTPLSLACALVDVRMVRMLMKRGANPHERHEVDLMHICWCPGQDPWLALLSSPRYGPQVSRLGLDDDMPFTTTIDSRIKIVELLVSHGSRPSAAAVAEAAAEGRTEMFDAYSRAFQPGDGSGALVATAALPFSPSVAAARFLLRAGAMVSCEVLTTACKQFDMRVDVVAVMLSAPGACSVNARDSLGRSALSLAAISYNELLVSALLAAGADSSSVDCNGRTALQLARATQPMRLTYGLHFCMKKDFCYRTDAVVRLLQIATRATISS